MTTHTTAKTSLSQRFLWCLACYFFLHIILRICLSDSLDYDEAEQVVLAQWLLPGYTDQPPLYTWIQYGLFHLFGTTVFSVSLLKNSLLFLAYASFYGGALAALKDTRAAILATISLLLIPQIGWESQRDMSHSVLVIFAASATLWQTMRCVKKQTLFNYCLLGISVAVGILAKANYLLFLITIAGGLSTLPDGRKILFSKKMALAICTALMLSGTYLLWIFQHQHILFSATGKFHSSYGVYPWDSIRSLTVNSILFLTPLWIFYLFIFPRGFKTSHTGKKTFANQLLRNYLLLLITLLFTIVLSLKITYVKDRWLQPLLFVVPIFFFSRLDPHSINPRQFKIFLTIVAVTATVIFSALIIRVVGGPYTHNFCRLNFPFSAMAEDIGRSGFNRGLIISNNRFIAGNMHHQFPDTMALIPGYGFEKMVKDRAYTKAAVMWDMYYGPAVPKELADYLSDTFHIRVSDYPVTYYKHRYKYARTTTVTLGVMQFPINALLRKSYNKKQGIYSALPVISGVNSIKKNYKLTPTP